jgi:hypothetical protein
MVTLIIGFVAGSCFGVIVMGVLAANAYGRGANDMIETLAYRRRLGEPTAPVTARPKKWVK